MTKKKPLIALTPYFNIERDEPYMRPAYLKAIRAAGGTPLILPLTVFSLPAGQIFTRSSSMRKPRKTAVMSACAGTAWRWRC